MTVSADEPNRSVPAYYPVSDKKNGTGSLSKIIQTELANDENVLGIKIEVIHQSTPSKRKKVSLSIKLDREDVLEYVKTIDFYLRNRKMLSRYKTSIEQLSAREKEICRFLSKGHSSTEIAELLFIATDTVRTHRKNIFRKLECNSVKELIFYSMLL
ncbi:helix-turn-helix transcriptional regulator [Niabella hirudinis]|uniref:helix-turn-helix transcriptional regulator n=1 Tax=Niabella hirudinis TaxID=1285929 RepID=UPI003EB94842